MPKATATIRIASDGRTTIPLEVREKLGIAGNEEYVEVEVRVDE